MFDIFISRSSPVYSLGLWIFIHRLISSCFEIILLKFHNGFATTVVIMSPYAVLCSLKFALIFGGILFFYYLLNF